MKNNLIKTGLTMFISVVLFSACQKSDDNFISPAPVATEKNMSMRELVSHPQFQKAYKQMEAKFRANNPDSRVEFIAPFFTSNGFGTGQNLILDFSNPEYVSILGGQFAFMYGEMGPNDFYRQNPDGTVSVHMSINNAYGEHYDIAPNVLHYGNKCNLTMNYTGPVISFDITDELGNVLFTFHFIDFFSNPNAVAFQGAGKVKLDGVGQQKTLVSKWICNPGWTQTNMKFTLN